MEYYNIGMSRILQNVHTAHALCLSISVSRSWSLALCLLLKYMLALSMPAWPLSSASFLNAQLFH